MDQQGMRIAIAVLSAVANFRPAIITAGATKLGLQPPSRWASPDVSALPSALYEVDIALISGRATVRQKDVVPTPCADLRCSFISVEQQQNMWSQPCVDRRLALRYAADSRLPNSAGGLENPIVRGGSPNPQFVECHVYCGERKRECEVIRHHRRPCHRYMSGKFVH